MQKIIVKFVPPLIRGEMVQQTVSREVIGFVTSQLNNEVNQEKVYNYLREKVIWPIKTTFFIFNFFNSLIQMQLLS